MAVELITEAVEAGARQKPACCVVGITCRTFQYWQKNGLQDRRQICRKTPANRLSEEERKKILQVCNSAEYAEKTPKVIVPMLADEGCYIASESSFHRILKEAKQMEHRGHSRQPGSNAKPGECQADKPHQVWSWDITYLPTLVKGVFLFLYLFMDIYDRSIVGWEVHENQDADLASDVLRKTRLSQQLPVEHEIILHSDNGSPMKGSSMLATMQTLGVVPSFSRPSVSDDNPYSESLFKTLKYVPNYPRKPFESIEAARQWVSGFVKWYNNDHRHSALKYVTPMQRRTFQDMHILESRKRVYARAKELHPERWSRGIRNWEHEPVVLLNPDKKKLKVDSSMKIAA